LEDFSTTKLKIEKNNMEKTISNEKIPKIIWQTWKTKQLDPWILQRIKQMLQLNPEYQHRLLTDDEIDAYVYKEYADRPDIIECYNRLNIIVAKVDFWRYLVLYKHGGVYLDMDSTILKPLDTLLQPEDEAILTCEGNPGLFVQWALIFAPGHPILKYTIDQIIYNIRNNSYPNNIHHMTGPLAYTLAINKYHKDVFGDELHHKDAKMDPSSNFVFTTDSCQYRLFGVDYNGYFQFKYPEASLLYRNVTHWTKEEKQKPLLKPIMDV
jgi:inositol phosphorylceramide mannosyltransferase catalytic subunit